MKRETITNLYGLFVFLMVLVLCIAYANIVTELKIEGTTEGNEQQGVYITEVEYLSNNGADTTNSLVNYFLGTMLDSKIVLGSSASSTITYKVTVKNNTDREQVFIGIIKDETNEEIYSNTSIQPNVETTGGITGLEEYVTTIAPGEYITFPVTYAYVGTDTSNPELQGKINFRFKEKPVVELSNEGETYTLENITVGHEEEYEFTVSNYNQDYTNGVPLTYTFATELTEGSPLEAKIYDSEGNEVTGSIVMQGDYSTQEDNTYTLKLIWDSSLTGEEYEGKSYIYTLKLTAIPDKTVDTELEDYADYEIEKTFGINITTCKHNYEEQPLPERAGTKFTVTDDYSDGTNTAKIPAGFTVSGVPDKKCTICGAEILGEYTVSGGLVVYLIDDKTETEIANIKWDDADTLLSLKKTYDQFVWIPMPKENINDMYMCQSEDGTKSCKIGLNSSGEAYCSTHNSTAMAGRLYSTVTGENYNPTLTTQTYTANSGLREPDVLIGTGTVTGELLDENPTWLALLNKILETTYSTANDFKTDLQSEYNEVVKSVYENEGFYIGRYETSGIINDNTNATVKIVAGSDNTTNASISSVIWYRMYAQQKNYAENKGLNGSIGSAMIQGAAYDQVMKFIDPTTSFVKTTGRVSHDLKLYQTGGLNYTGSITYNDVAKNIYDLEGNVRTWTSEADGTAYRSMRGSDYYSIHSPSYKTYVGCPEQSSGNWGSVIQLYIHDSHTYSNWVTTKEATCGEAGTKIGTCGCGATTTETIPATGDHNVVDGECTVCGKVFNTAPVIVTNTLNEKTTTSFTINANATDIDGDTLTYTLYTSTSQDGTYTAVEPEVSSAQNTQITLNKTGLVNYTTYWWYYTVTDGIETVTSDKQSVKTYCPGPVTTTCSKGYKCTSQGTGTATCTYCKGTGEWTGSSSTNSDCGAVLTNVLDSGKTYSNKHCSDCSSQFFYEVFVYCPNYSECGLSWEGYQCECGQLYDYPADDLQHGCTECGGDGKMTTTTACSHGKYSAHYYCDTHKVELNNTTTHTVTTDCGHTGATGQHD